MNSLKTGAFIALTAGALFAGACTKKQQDDKPAEPSATPVAAPAKAAGEPAATPTTAAPAGEQTAKIHCMGVNACKGHGACKTAANACAGQNGCKGHGMVELTESDCKAQGGTVAAN